MYLDSRKALPWFGDLKETRTSEHREVHSRLDQLSYPLRFI